MFGVVFPNRSFPIDISTFSQIDTFHWILDMNTFVGEAYDEVKEMCIFLLNNFTLPPDKALAVYLQSPGSPFVFCGAITISRPSAVLSLTWPQPGSGLLQITLSDSILVSAKIGVSVVDLASLQSLDVSAQRKIEHLALKVGENLFNFMNFKVGLMYHFYVRSISMNLNSYCCNLIHRSCMFFGIIESIMKDGSK